MRIVLFRSKQACKDLELCFSNTVDPRQSREFVGGTGTSNLAWSDPKKVDREMALEHVAGSAETRVEKCKTIRHMRQKFDVS